MLWASEILLPGPTLHTETLLKGSTGNPPASCSWQTSEPVGYIRIHALQPEVLFKIFGVGYVITLLFVTRKHRQSMWWAHDLFKAGDGHTKEGAEQAQHG